VSGRALRASTLAIIALAILGFGGQSLGRLWNMKREVDGLEREIAALRAETDRVSSSVARLRSDPDSIEQIAREEHGYVRPYEENYVVVVPPGVVARVPSVWPF
jgi:cell division protein FtsB